MRKLAMLAGVFTLVFSVVSCNSRSAETEEAYAELVSNTDSIQKINMMLKDTLSAVMQLNADYKGSAMMNDSSAMEEVARYEVELKNKEAELNKISEQAGNFEAFESEYATGDMSEVDLTAKIDEIKKEQKDVFSSQKNVERDLENIKKGYWELKEARDNQMMNDNDGALTSDEAKQISKSKK